MAYDRNDTERRIFAAASAEFAEHGLAGARIDRIAKAAKANKQAIYLYYGNKEKLFARVLRATIEDICAGLSIDPDALAESAGQLFDACHEHPQMLRLMLWESLEGGSELEHTEPERRAEMREKIHALVDRGMLSHLPECERVRASQDLLFSIMALVSWSFAVPRMCRIVLDESSDRTAVARRRETVMKAAHALAQVSSTTA